RAQVALEARHPRGAEHAAHRAADLARDALRDGPKAVGLLRASDRIVGAAGALRDEHGLHAAAVAQRKEQLARAVVGHVLARHFDERAQAFLLETGTQALREVRHARRIHDAAPMDPAEDLRRAVARLAPL